MSIALERVQKRANSSRRHRIMRASVCTEYLDAGFSVCVDTDWSSMCRRNRIFEVDLCEYRRVGQT